jgi:hypothetical protein
LANPKHRRSITRTIRINEDVDRALHKFSEEEGTSVSLTVNRALRRYVEWDAFAEKFGFINVPSSIHAKMFSYLTDEQARDLGEWAGQNFARDFIVFWFKKVNVETTLKALELLGSEYARLYQFDHASNGKNHTIILKHGRGPKGSSFNEEFVKGLFKGLLSKDVKTERTEDQVVANVTL